MDYEFYLRAAQSGLKFGHSREYWGTYRFHPLSKSISSPDLMKKDGDIIFERYNEKGISDFGIWCREKYYKLIRLGWKFILGSYPRFVLFKRDISIE